MDEESRRRIWERAHALREADGRPEGRADDYWSRAEQELMDLSVAGEEDPLEALDHEVPEPAGGGESEIGDDPHDRRTEAARGTQAWPASPVPTTPLGTTGVGWFPPDRTIREHVPELRNGLKTCAGGRTTIRGTQAGRHVMPDGRVA